jgi:predicted MPP superfamily phosphohydrolase
MLPDIHLWPVVIGAFVGAIAISYAVYRLIRRWRAPEKRPPWIAASALGLFTLIYGVVVYAWLIEPEMLVVRRVEIVSDQWRGAPLTIAAIGDTHVGGPHVDSARVLRVVQRINRLRPELVVLLGDYVNGHEPDTARTPAENQEILGGVATFAALNARYGVVAVAGNHDGWYNRQAIISALQEAGVAALSNRSIVIHRSGGQVVVAGLEDLWTGHPDLTAALDGAPADADTIVIAHNPDTFAAAPAGPALFLGAHAHCGQVSVPFYGRPILPLHNKRYACHLIRENDKVIYVTAGIGESIAPVRFLNPPEIVLITLRGSPQAPAPSPQPNSDN